MLSEQLLSRIRERAQDPMRRSDAAGLLVSSTDFETALGQISLPDGQIQAMRGLIGQFADILKDFRVMTPDAQTQDLQQSEPEALSAPATAEQLADADTALGQRLPDELRQLYSIADGGFGPAAGLFSLQRLIDEYHGLTNEPAGPQNQPWPANLLPLVDMQPGYDCLDLESGAVIAWNPEEIEGYSNAAWRRSFQTAAPSLAAWLEQWLDTPTAAERADKDRLAFAETSARVAIEYYAKLSATERAEHGLPEVGWEDELRRRHGCP